MEPASRILLLRLKSIGDILFTLPAVHSVRDNFPEAHLAFLVSQEHAPLLSGFAGVDEVIALDRALYQPRRITAACTHTLALLRRLRGGRFTLAIDFQGYGETALLTWLTRAPERWGAVYRAGRAWAYTRPVRRDDRQHPADWNLALLERCGLPRTPVRNALRLPEGAARAAAEFFAARQLTARKPTLFIQPFTSAGHKNWPLEKWLALAAHWQARGLHVLFGGGPADRAALEPAVRAGFAVSAGVPLLTTAGLMNECALVVGGDTGLLHLAVALGRRALMLIHSISPGSSFPYRRREWALTPPPGQLVPSISVETVIGATARALVEEGVPIAPHAIGPP